MLWGGGITNADLYPDWTPGSSGIDVYDYELIPKDEHNPAEGFHTIWLFLGIPMTFPLLRLLFKESQRAVKDSSALYLVSFVVQYRIGNLWIDSPSSQLGGNYARFIIGGNCTGTPKLCVMIRETEEDEWRKIQLSEEASENPLDIRFEIDISDMKHFPFITVGLENA